jgi:alpha/beta superfamily hydrolase
MTEPLELTTSDGVTLEARIDSPSQPTRLTVFCHPHPLRGGSMNAPLMIAVAAQLVENGHSVLRFNFRGTGASEGQHDYSRGELNDITAAFAFAETRELPVSLTGWSFGAAAALQWLADSDSTVPYVGLAPPPENLPDDLPSGPKRVIIGNRDQIIDGEALRTYAVDHGIDLLITSGDHFFHGRGKRIGDLVAQGLKS